jgi:N-acetylmuramoyl-L-alanine amidase
MAPNAPLPKIIGSTRVGQRPLVVIDPGHGGHDTGALSTVYGNRPEKDATLAIAMAIRDALVRSGRVRVALTRTDDRFLVLGDRVEIARRLHADLFISIHCDSSPTGPSAHGATVYTLSEVASDKVAARIAAQENKSDVINGVDLGAQSGDVSSILVDLTQRETMNVSSAFAALLQREMSMAIPFTSNFHRFAGFRVLKAPDMPSVLIETGYLTNPGDARFLFSKEGQRKIAEGVRRAVEAHFARRLARLEGRIPS